MSEAVLEGARMVAVCVPDNVGRLIGKRAPVRRWPEIRRTGLSMPDFHLVTGVENQPFGDLDATGDHTGFRNGLLRPLPETLFRTDLEPGTAFVLAEALDQSGRPRAEAPRAILARQAARLAERGLAARCACELEFYLFRTSYADAHAGGYGGLVPFHHYPADNDVLIAGYAEPFLAELRRIMAQAGLADDTSQGEGGPGQHEITLAPAGPEAAADQAAIYKHLTKALAQQAGLSATFMAKVDERWAGSGGHLHIQVTDSAGRGILGEGDGLSRDGAAFLAGLLRFAPELTLLHAPYANSYRRLRPGSFAPVTSTWGWDNRTCLVRLVGRGEGLRFEFRLPGADANPYHAIAAVLASGREGLELGLEPPPPVAGNACDMADAGEHLPRDLAAAHAAFHASELAAAAFGPAVHKHLLDLAAKELDAARAAVTDWDRRRGFERA